MTQPTFSLNKQIIYVTGLPRAGSTLLCQLLGHHPHIYSPGHSSPLSPLLINLRHNLSDNQFLLAQLDVDFDLAYRRMINAYRGFINGWFAETDRPVVVDKNRGWLALLETVNLLDPNFKMIICLRELGQLFGSIESQHQKTLLLDFPDHMAAHSVYSRADILFGKEGVVGGPLKSIENLQDVAEPLKSRLCYLTFEALTTQPVETLRNLFRWLELPEARIDPQRLTVKPHESDSYYRFKYPHQTFSAIRPPTKRVIPARIEQEIKTHFTWFYRQFYPDHLGKETG